MGMRITRTGKVIHVGHYLRSWIERSQYKCQRVVQIVVEVQDGPDKGREVRVSMTPDAARAHIADVQAAIESVEERNARGSEL